MVDDCFFNVKFLLFDLVFPFVRVSDWLFELVLFGEKVEDVFDAGVVEFSVDVLAEGFELGFDFLDFAFDLGDFFLFFDEVFVGFVDGEFEFLLFFL